MPTQVRVLGPVALAGPDGSPVSAGGPPAAAAPRDEPALAAAALGVAASGRAAAPRNLRLVPDPPRRHNRIDVDDVKELADLDDDPACLDRLAALTGHPPSVLLHALPELRHHPFLDTTILPGACPTPREFINDVRPPCRRCAAGGVRLNPTSIMITSQLRATAVIALIVSVDIARAAKTVSFAAGAEHALAKIEQAATATPAGIPAAAGARPAAIPSGNSAFDLMHGRRCRPSASPPLVAPTGLELDVMNARLLLTSGCCGLTVLAVEICQRKRDAHGRGSRLRRVRC